LTADLQFTETSLVSIIIPCYNHAHYLPQAIDSILTQSYQKTEIIVVDDGSIDHTREVAEGFSNVTYIYQSNQGVSAARNTGITKSKGDYLVFLDADDWLLPDALSINLKYLLQNTEAGLVVGAYNRYFESTAKQDLLTKVGAQLHYKDFLKGNIISMQAAVMFRRKVFDQLRYDTSLKACEDWDLYLKIAYGFPIISHTQPIAVYRRYSSSLSGNFALMLETGIMVLDRQNNLVKTDEERKLLVQGKKKWKKKYTRRIFNNLMPFRNKQDSEQGLDKLRRYNKYLYFKYFVKRWLS
jgi:glycosyltransferase involved in cell wall biosynthesis